MSPYAPKRPCLEPRCPNLTEGGGRCAQHARAYDLQRGSAKARGYDSAWAKFSKNWRQRFPLCGMRRDGQLHAEHSQCVQEGRTSPAACVDHIVSMANGGAQYDESNLQSLCLMCNNRKRVTHDGGFGR
ncbi:MAG: hypothetical protein A3H95_13885 [Acidobacteria bacterium RIFCSPLOWO2_02_FULL_64_15]|nr:MAG: hypothetical protein A3H95_13885 [Acidobacteria bacterium RIFCSPLOWO2_02_FULL_64_15]